MLFCYLLETLFDYPYNILYNYPCDRLLFQKVYMALSSLIEYLENVANSRIPTILQNVGLALLSILIPLAIVILTQALQTKTELKSDLQPKEELKSDLQAKEQKSENFSSLDLHVILDYVFQIKLLVTATILIFFPLIFWDTSCGYLRLAEIIISLTGICLLIRTILKVYHWTKGNVFDYRLNYLKQVKNLNDLEVVWRSVWKSDMNPFYAKEFFEVFSKTIDEKVEKFAE